MLKFTASVHDSIGNYTKATIRGENVNDDKIYYNAFFNKPEDNYHFLKHSANLIVF